MILPAMVRSMAALALLMGSALDHNQVTEKIAYYADLHQVSYEEMYVTIECESSFQTSEQSQVKVPTGPNGREDSWGIVQINLPWHPEITKEQALDPDFSINYMAKQFALGHQSWWSCYNLKYGNRLSRR